MSSSMNAPPTLVLFDLDGTLVDSAPDLCGSANDMRVERGLEPKPYQQLRPLVGTGARGMIGAAFGLGPDDGAEFTALRDEFLERYARRLLQQTRPFDGIEAVLARLEAEGVAWGIVTNKPSRYTLPIINGLGLGTRAAAIVCGDTTPFAKPHPAPLLEAARRCGAVPTRSVYVGDDLRDVHAGRAAGMSTVAAAWGYLGDGAPITEWGAEAVAAAPSDLLKLLHLP